MIKNQWYAILPSKRVKFGQIVAVKRMNLDLALVRNRNGNIGCVVDQCTHRGAPLSLGKIKDDCIQCPTSWIMVKNQDHLKNALSRIPTYASGSLIYG